MFHGPAESGVYLGRDQILAPDLLDCQPQFAEPLGASCESRALKCGEAFGGSLKTGSLEIGS